MFVCRCRRQRHIIALFSAVKLVQSHNVLVEELVVWVTDVCLSVCLSVCMSVCPSVRLWMSVVKLVKSQLLLLYVAVWIPLTMQGTYTVLETLLLVGYID